MRFVADFLLQKYFLYFVGKAPAEASPSALQISRPQKPEMP